MFKLLDVEKFVSGLIPVTSPDIFSQPDVFHQDGLFSETIFGPLLTPQRLKTYSYIDLKVPILHPSVYRMLIRLSRNLVNVFSAQTRYSINSKGELVEDPNGGDIVGIPGFVKRFPEIRFANLTGERAKIYNFLLKAYQDRLFTVQKIPVIPPDFRPAFKSSDGRWIIDSINDAYIKILRRTLGPVTTSGVTGAISIFHLQEEVMKYDDLARARIGKKFGLIRSSILGKRVDYSGRAVISANPSLRINEISLPFKMAVKMFEPFIIHKLLYSGEDTSELREALKEFTNEPLSVDVILKVIRAIKDGDHIPDRLKRIMWNATEASMAGRVVIAKRDPVLHRESVRAFYPVLSDTDTIGIPSLQVGGFNADFDGDTMAVYHPLTDEAQLEARTKMMSFHNSATVGGLAFSLSKEMYTGLYLLTKDPPPSHPSTVITVQNEESIKRMSDIYQLVSFRGKVMTVGRWILALKLPEEFQSYVSSKPADRKVIDQIFKDLLAKGYPQDQIANIAYELQDLGFKYATLFAPSISLDDLTVSEKLNHYKQQLAMATPEQAEKILTKMKAELPELLKDSSLYDLVESGGAKSWQQPLQIIAAKGTVSDAEGNILPTISKGLADGLTPNEYFNMGYGARYGIINRVINTADTGYFSRILAYVLNSVELHRTLTDCGTQRAVQVKLNKDLRSRLSGRFIINDKTKKVEFLDLDNFADGDTIKLRSPIFCKSPKICHTCYGNLWMQTRSPYVGLIAAQVIGERGTQLIMRVFHLGGTVNVQIPDILKDITENNFEIRDKTLLSKYLYQDQTRLITKMPCRLTIVLDPFYTYNYNLVIKETSIWVKSLIATVLFSDGYRLELILDYPVELQLGSSVVKREEVIEISYGEEDDLLKVPSTISDVQKQVLYVQRLLSGREITKGPHHLLSRLVSVYSSFGAMDLVHLEVLVSHVLRAKKDLSKPARLIEPYEPILLNIKEVVFVQSPLQGLAFENVNKSIMLGLLSEKSPEELSILEQVLAGDFKEIQGKFTKK